MEHFLAQLWSDVEREVIGDGPHVATAFIISFRCLLAALLGALPGLQRERRGFSAGLRTHMLVSLGSAVFVMAALQAGSTVDDTTRVIQGIATGIGFIGAGAIMKSAQEHAVHGLTTAASIWLTAALGAAVGMGRILLPLVGSLLAIFILAVLWGLEKHQPPNSKP